MDEQHFRENIIIVLNEPQDIVNIAGTARAMMNMGLRRLRLVRPAVFEPHRITGIAHGSEVVLERTEHFDSLDDALADSPFIVGTSARRRGAPYVWQTPREAAPELLARADEVSGPITIVFGREDAGLRNEDLDRCDRILTVPTAPDRSSINLAQAVLIVTYELWLAGPGGKRKPRRMKRSEPPADAEVMRTMFEAAKTALHRIDFFNKREPEVIMRRIRAIARRADLDEGEARLLRAMAIEVRKTLDRATSRS